MSDPPSFSGNNLGQLISALRYTTYPPKPVSIPQGTGDTVESAPQDVIRNNTPRNTFMGMIRNYKMDQDNYNNFKNYFMNKR